MVVLSLPHRASLQGILALNQEANKRRFGHRHFRLSVPKILDLLQSNRPVSTFPPSSSLVIVLTFDAGTDLENEEGIIDNANPDPSSSLESLPEVRETVPPPEPQSDAIDVENIVANQSSETDQVHETKDDEHSHDMADNNSSSTCLIRPLPPSFLCVTNNKELVRVQSRMSITPRDSRKRQVSDDTQISSAQEKRLRICYGTFHPYQSSVTI